MGQIVLPITDMTALALPEAGKIKLSVDLDGELKTLNENGQIIKVAKPAIASFNTVYVSEQNGNDQTAVPGDMGFPYATLSAAITFIMAQAAQTSYAMIVLPGQYLNTPTIAMEGFQSGSVKRTVSAHFMGGTTVANLSGFPLFAVGSNVDFNITGHADFYADADFISVDSIDGTVNIYMEAKSVTHTYALISSTTSYVNFTAKIESLITGGLDSIVAFCNGIDAQYCVFNIAVNNICSMRTLFRTDGYYNSMTFTSRKTVEQYEMADPINQNFVYMAGDGHSLTLSADITISTYLATFIWVNSGFSCALNIKGNINYTDVALMKLIAVDGTDTQVVISDGVHMGAMVFFVSTDSGASQTKIRNIGFRSEAPTAYFLNVFMDNGQRLSLDQCKVDMPLSTAMSIQGIGYQGVFSITYCAFIANDVMEVGFQDVVAAFLVSMITNISVPAIASVSEGPIVYADMVIVL